MFGPFRFSCAALVLVASTVGADSAVDFAKASPQQVADAVSYKKTKFDIDTKILGPFWTAPFAVAGQRPDAYYDKSSLVAYKNSAGAPTITLLQILIVYRAKDWANFDTTTLEGGRTPETTPMARRQLGCDADGTCGFVEGVAAQLPKGYLAANAENGFDIRISAKDGSQHVLTVPSNYIKGILLALARPLGADGLPAGAPAGPAK